MVDKIIPITLYRARLISSKSYHVGSTLSKWQPLGYVCINVPYERVERQTKNDDRFITYLKSFFFLSILVGITLAYFGISRDPGSRDSSLSASGLVGFVILCIDVLIAIGWSATKKSSPLERFNRNLKINAIITAKEIQRGIEKQSSGHRKIELMSEEEYQEFLKVVSETADRLYKDNQRKK